MLYKQICNEIYEEENTIGFDLKIVKGETKSKSNYNDNLFQRAKHVEKLLKKQSGQINEDCQYIQCKMKLNCYYYNEFSENNNMVYWGGLQLIDGTLYILYMTSSIENMLFIKKEDPIANVYNFSSDYFCLLDFMKSYESGRIYGTDGQDFIREFLFLLIADGLNVDHNNEFLEYDFIARVFRKEFIDLTKFGDNPQYDNGVYVHDLFKGYNYDKICAVHASPIYVSLL